MANERDIKIGIKTTADTSGAKAAEEAIKKVGQASDQAEGGGFGRDTAAARRIAELEAAEAAEAQADSLKKLAQSTKDAAKELPALGEADIVAEGMERLGKSADAASGKTGGGGLAGMARMIMGVINPVGLITGAVTAGAAALWNWKRSLDEVREAAIRGGEQMAQDSRAYIENERRTAAAAESTRQLAAARRESDISLQQSIAELGNYARELERVMDLQKEERAFRDELLDESTRAALAGAEGDPVAQAQIRDNTRRAKQEQELADMDADILANKEIEARLWVEISAALEKKKKALEDASALDDPIETARREAADAENIAANMRKQEADQRAEAEGLKGSKRSAAVRVANQLGDGASTAEEMAERKSNEVALLEQQQEAARKAAEAQQKEIAEREKRNQETFDNRQRLERDRERKGIIFDRRDATSGIEMENLRKREEEKREKERADDQERRLRDQEKRTGEEAGIGREALGLLPKDLPEKGRKAVERVARGLQDGDQGGEIKELIALMERLADAVDGKDTKTSIKIDGVLSRIKKLESK